MTESYKNKYFSVLGDSISTLEGYTKPDHCAFYDTAKKRESGIFVPSDTWWGQVINTLGGKCLVNNSISGSMVCRHRLCETESYACSDERTSALSDGGVTPDVIMVYIGTNDWGCGAPLVPETEAQADDLTVFSVAYRAMLEKLKRNYPYAEIWCFTLAVSKCEKDAEFSFPYLYAGIHIEKYCELIRSIACEYSCRVIDLLQLAEPYDTIDGFHPNAAGMKTLSCAVTDLLKM